MSYEFAMVTPQPMTRDLLSRALESLGPRVSLTLFRHGELSMVTAANGVPLCTIYSSRTVELREIEGFGALPEGTSHWTDVTVASGSGRLQFDFVHRLAEQLGGALLTPEDPWRPAADLTCEPGYRSDSGAREVSGWRPPQSALASPGRPRG